MSFQKFVEGLETRDVFLGHQLGLVFIMLPKVALHVLENGRRNSHEDVLFKTFVAERSVKLDDPQPKNTPPTQIDLEC